LLRGFRSGRKTGSQRMIYGGHKCVRTLREVKDAGSVNAWGYRAYANLATRDRTKADVAKKESSLAMKGPGRPPDPPQANTHPSAGPAK